MNKQTYYEQIQKLHGIGEVKEIVAKWDKILTNLPNKSVDAPLLLPNLLLKSKAGAGKSNFIYLLSEYLYNSGFMAFYGDVKFFEFFLEYVPADANMAEINRFEQQLKMAAGFRNEFRGVVAINVSMWKGHVEEAYFITFLHYLSIIETNTCVIFTCEDFNKEESDVLEKVLTSFCRIRAVDFDYPKPAEFAKYCVEQIEKFSLTLDESAENLLAQSITKLMQSEYFYGYKTVYRLSLDVAFELGATYSEHKGVISAEQLQAFNKDSEFINKLYAVKKIPRIGFNN